MNQHQQNFLVFMNANIDLCKVCTFSGHSLMCIYICVCVCVCVCGSLSWRILDIEFFHSYSERMMCKLHTQKAVSAV